MFSAPYHRSLSAYAAATGAELKVAVFWARWSIWTLVSPERLLAADGSLELNMETALRVNELGRLGDRMVATTAPLRLRLSTDPERTSPIAADGTVQLTFAKAQVFCANRELTDPVDQEIAWIFMQHGQWTEDGPLADIDGDRLRAVEFIWQPEEPSGQGFDMVGTLSRIFARYYAEHTIDEAAVIQRRAPLRPDWFAPFMRLGRVEGALPLWQFIQEPNFDPVGSEPADVHSR